LQRADQINANINTKDSDGRTPLSWAAEKGHEAVVKLLVETGKADVNLRSNYGQTPLSWAAEKGTRPWSSC
jgi:ankyrin repeat protein